jgi:DNA-binding NarL/FixJ family response regulator
MKKASGKNDFQNAAELTSEESPESYVGEHTACVARVLPRRVNGPDMDVASTMTDCISVWIVTARRALRRRLQAHLARDKDINVTGNDSDDLAFLTDDVKRWPKVLLLDGLLLDSLDGHDLEALRRYVGLGRVLLLLNEASDGAVQGILRHRFHGYLLTSCRADACVKAIHAVIGGDIWLPRAQLARATEQLLCGADDSPESNASRESASLPFTPREQQILALLKQGLSNKQIARRLDVVEDTVKKHLQHVYDKLGVRRRTMVILSSVSG